MTHGYVFAKLTFKTSKERSSLYILTQFYDLKTLVDYLIDLFFNFRCLDRRFKLGSRTVTYLTQCIKNLLAIYPFQVEPKGLLS